MSEECFRACAETSRQPVNMHSDHMHPSGIEFSASPSARPMKQTLACALGLLLSTPALGQDHDRQKDIIVTGVPLKEALSLDKVVTPILDTPQTISVVSQEEMTERGVNNLSDALRTVPGISLGAGETSWQGNNLILRGFTTRNDTFLDGMRDYGYYFRDPFNSTSIEVLKGPGSVLFGRGSTGGVINQVSKMPKLDQQISGELTLGDNDLRRATVDANTRLGQSAALRINAMAHRSEVADRDGALNRRWGVAPTLAIGIDTATEFTFSYFHQEEDNRPDYGIPWFNGAPAKVDRDTYYGFSDDYLKTNVDIVTSELKHKLSDHVSLRGQLRYSNARRSFRTSEAVIPSGTPLNTPLSSINVTRNEFSGFSRDRFVQGQVDATARFTTGPFRHTLIIGTEIGSERPEPAYIFHTGVIGTSLVDPHRQTFSENSQYLRLTARARVKSLGLYALDTIDLAPNWIGILGLRWDKADTNYQSVGFTPAGTVAGVTRIDRNDARLTGRAALVFKPTADSSLYASFANSFNPSAEGIESLISAGRSVAQANVNTDPETGRIFEIGGKLFALDKHVLLTGALFDIRKSNVRVPDAVASNVNMNGGQQRVRGFEMEVTGQVTPRWSLKANFAYTDSETLKTGNPLAPGSPRVGERLPNAPKYSATFGSNYRLGDNFTVGGEVLYQSSRLGQNTNALVLLAPGYALFNAMARYRITDDASFQVNILNIGDKLYYDQLHPFHVIPGAGRSVAFSIILN